MRNNIYKTYQAGVGLIELVVAISIISITLFSLVTVSRVAFRSVTESSHRVRASYLLEETFESLKIMRDNDWGVFSAIPLDEERNIVFENGMWAATTTDIVIDGLFHRSFVLREVFRDPLDDIAPSGTIDPGARRAEITVEWNERGKDISVTTISYIMNLFEE